MNSLEQHFQTFRKQIVGDDQTFQTPFGEKRILYADWVASGRLYAPIEQKLAETFGPFVGNTHTETSVTGTTTTRAYHYAHDLIKQHVNAGKKDVIITAGFGMTAVINKFQRILGVRVPERFRECALKSDYRQPVVFVTHMEHHSNHTSWLETLAKVVVVEPSNQGTVDLDHLRKALKEHQDWPVKIGSFSACSNVTGIETPYHDMAKIMHEFGGLCFVDFAASAPYVDMNMHPADPQAKLDAVFFSPHKFLGGPGTSGVLIFDSELYHSSVPDHPGGGTVDWTNPWGVHRFIQDIELREDGGTPGFLQAIRTALCIELKDQLDVEKMWAREHELVKKAFTGLRVIPDLYIMADNIEHRLGIISFYSNRVHYNLMVKLLNDRYGIQVRGGCSCAGTYGHYLLHIDPNRSKEITDKIDSGDLSAKPGWVRLSLHPTMTDNELDYIIQAIAEIIRHADQWQQNYRYDPHTNEFSHTREVSMAGIREWFRL
ncbi:aminotransferase class V-fold PLP-dependent enzyme [candidate division KSB1 bacterium]|nr:aminotransferase class V-fold PLP-dependent enzyme [candidate division KSB1 bacterium]